MKTRIKKGDLVKVISGSKDMKGKTGKVLEVIRDGDKWRVRVEGLNMIKRHTRPSARQTGGIVEKEAAVHLSNVALVDPKDGKATRIGFRTLEDGRKVRFAKRSGEIID